MNRYAKSKDANQDEIVQALEKAGCAVTDISGAGFGFTDLFVTRAGIHYLVEVKTEKGKLRKSQIEFHVKHKPAHTVRTIEEAFRAVGLIT